MSESIIGKLEYLKSMTSFVEGIAEEMMKGDGEIKEVSRDLKENYGNLMDELLRIEKLKNIYSRLEEYLKDPEFVEALKYVEEHWIESVFSEPVLDK